MRVKLIAAILGLMVAIPAAVIAQNPDDQDQYSKPSPNIQAPAPGPNDQGYSNQDSMDQDSIDSSSMDPSSNDADANAPTANTPAPVENNGVARISLIHGDVSTQRGDSKDWSAAALNAPVVAGDRVSTGDKARTELQLDYANMLRLAEHSQANITQLTRSQIQIQLGHGMANYTVLKNSDADAEVDTPNVSIRTERRESSFRILVTADDHTEVLVRKGEIEVTTPQGGTRVGENQFITIQGSGADAQYKIGEAPARDDFDQWNSDRDNMIRNSVARKHTNDYYVGTEDLDNHGTWSEVPDYGPVWRPSVSDPDWAPYRNGRWVYEPYWGWTWVSYDSWGWAPYHYGRWMYVGGGWGWWPGPAYGYPFYRPIWAPAYVSFVGWGGGFGVGFGWGGGWGSIGWLPLGPCDHFHPWWGRWGGRFGARDIHTWNRGGFAPLHGGNRFSNVNLALHDQHFRGGTTVSGNEFGRGRMNARPISHGQFQNARFTTGKVPVNASRESFSASGRPAAPSTTRNVSQNQHFFSGRGTTAGGSNGRSTGNGREFGSPANSNGGFHSSPGSGRGSETRMPGNSGSRGDPGMRPSRTGNADRASMGGERGSGNGGWQKFSPMPSRPASESGRGNEAGRAEGFGRTGGSASQENRGSYGPSRGSASDGRGYGRGSYGGPRAPVNQGRSYGGPSRPPLNMRQPIVVPRSYGGARSVPGYGGGRSAPGYGGGRSAPSYGGGGHSAPSNPGGGSPHGGGGGASHSGGGGGSHGGGGRHGR
jgi:hypothetical protein